MNRQKLKLHYFLYEFLNFLETYQPNFSYNVAILFMLIHHLQILSFLVKADNHDYWEPKIAFFMNIPYYCNFSHIIELLNSEIITEIVFFLVEIALFCSFFGFFMLLILKRLVNITNILKSRRTLMFYQIFAVFLNIFNWVLLIPILDFYSTIYQCPSKTGFCTSFYAKVLSLAAIIFTILISLLIFWANRTHSFLEKGFFRMNFTFSETIVLILRYFLICLFYILLENAKVLIYLLIIIIFLISVFNFLANYAISDQIISPFFFQFLMNGLLIAFLYFLMDFTTILSQRNLFYTLFLALLYFCKASIKAFEKSRKAFLNADFGKLKTLSISLSVFYTFFQQKQLSSEADFYFYGLLRTHVFICNDSHCPLKKEEFLAFEKLPILSQNRLINDFISHVFIKTIRNKNTRNSHEFELLLLKYGSFITYHNMNPVHAFLDLEKAFSLNKTPSFYFKSIVRSLEKSLKDYIREYDKSSKEKSLTESKELDVLTFALMHKVKKKLNKDFQVLLKEKLIFWELFKNGFASYDELFKSIDKLNTKVLAMSDFLKKTLKQSHNSLTYKMFPLKYLSILTCVFMNHLNEGVKLEDEIEKLKKREASFHKEILNSTSFFEDNVLFLQVSFLNPEGFILETSKTQKLAEFFGYSREESKSIRSIKEFMPKIFKTFHRDFVLNYINKPRTSKSQEKAKIETFAQDKSGVVFAVKIYLGHCFDYANDFVFQSAIIRPKADQQMLLFDKNGDIQGMSKGFFNCLEEEFNHFAIKDLYLLNVYCLIPNLQDIMEKNKGFQDETVIKIRNKLGFLYIPGNLGEIVEILKLKLKDEDERSQRSYVSSRSQKTDRSGKKEKEKEYHAPEGNSGTKNSKFMTKLFQTTTQFSQDYRNVLQKKYAENTLQNYEVMKEFMDYKEARRYKINFDLLFGFHDIAEGQNIKYSTLIIQKISQKDEKKETAAQNASYIEMKSQSLIDTPDKDPTLLIDSEIKSGFINMPPVNVPEFREPPSPGSEAINPENNRLFTTEAAENNTKPVILEVNLSVPKGLIPNVKSNIFNNMLGVGNNNNNNMPSLNEVGSSNEEKQRKDEDSLAESSVSEKKNADMEKVIGRTSNEKIYEIQDISSQSSSLSSLKKTFAIFNMMGLIQRQTPHSLYAVFLSRISEIIFILIYCVYVIILSKQYIYSYYMPLEEGLVNFSDMYNAFALSTSLLFQNELSRNNYSAIDENSIDFSLFVLNMEESYNTMQDKLQIEEKKMTEHQYQGFFKTTDINVTDIILPVFRQMGFKVFCDKITELSHESRNLDPNILDEMESEYFITNFLPYNDKIEDLTTLIWNEFYSTNSLIFDSIQLVLILFIVILFLLKFFEFYQLEVFYQLLVKIVNIFLRTNQSEALNEIFVSNETIKQISDESDRFLSLNYGELLLNRKTIKALEEDLNTNQRKVLENKNKKKKGHLTNVKRNNMKPLSRIPRLMFSLFSYILIFCFLFFNYFYFSIVNDQIVQLINISLIFQNLYTLPSGIIAEKILLIREKVITNEFSTEINRNQRILDLYAKLSFNVNDLENVNGEIPTYTVFASEQINKAEFSNILTGNICDVLSNAGQITDAENTLCESIYDGAFKKGLLSVDDNFLNTIKINSAILDPNNIEFTDEIMQFLKAESVAIDVLAIIFVNQAMVLFYQDLQGYYQNGMLTQQGNLQIMLIVTTIFMGGGFLVIIIWYLYFCRRLYRNITLTLSMIPYERLINDEQTVFLIKKFGKD